MAEALALVGLAGNIVQFLDTGAQLFVLARKFYKGDPLRENVELEKKIRVLQASLDEVKRSSHLAHSPELAALVSECSTLSVDLMALLQRVKPETGQKSILKSMSGSFKAMRKKGELESMERRLITMRDAICSYLDILLSGQHRRLSSSVTDPDQFTGDFKDENTAKLESMVSKIVKELQSTPWDTNGSTAFIALSNQMQNFSYEAKYSAKVKQILESLHFEQINQRASAVAEAHRATFEWVFKDDGPTNFTQWLSSSDSIFWISGKAGSGKSTLMKFILSHPPTRHMLREWAGQKRLVIASHYFWTAGTPMQKSQTGLLKTLLFHIFLENPGVIPEACPTRWGEDSLQWMLDWDRDELLQCLKSLAQLTSLTNCIALFIDGLDEYEVNRKGGEGDHTELISLILALSKSPNIKICVTSRPWQDFIDAFGSSPWKLQVHTLTQNDIKLYTHDKLSQNSQFQELQLANPKNAEELVTEIQRKAQGVFLWVHLVSESLLRSLRHGDELLDLRRRLDELPGDLEEYYEHMMNTIEPFYQAQAAWIFKVMLHPSSSMLPVLLFYFLDQERNDPAYAFGSNFKPLPEEEVSGVIERKKRQLNVRCRDLIHFINNDATKSPTLLKSNVEFVHRTAVDFLRTERVQDLLTNRWETANDLNSSMSKAYLAIVKSLDFATLRTEWKWILGVIYFAKEIETYSSCTNNVLVLDLETCLLSTAEDFDWKRLAPPPCIPPSADVHSFLDIAIRFDLQKFVTAQVARLSGNVPALNELIYQVLSGIHYVYEQDFDGITRGSRISLSLLKLLLEEGADPNAKLEGDELIADRIAKGGFSPTLFKQQAVEHPERTRTLWTNFLLQVHAVLHDYNENPKSRENPRTSVPQNAYEVCEIFVAHGASRYYLKINAASETGFEIALVDDLLRAIFQDRATDLIRLFKTEDQSVSCLPP